jgi:YHS domain-containing protein
MKNISLLIGLFAIALFITCCSNENPKKNVEANITSVAGIDTIKFTPAMVDNNRDPSCGMPVSAGIGDTVHYKNKVLGFCSKECKDDFLKDPEKNITAADLKK